MDLKHEICSEHTASREKCFVELRIILILLPLSLSAIRPMPKNAWLPWISLNPIIHRWQELSRRTESKSSNSKSTGLAIESLTLMPGGAGCLTLPILIFFISSRRSDIFRTVLDSVRWRLRVRAPAEKSSFCSSELLPQYSRLTGVL